jgi:hypothetical protein
MGHGPRQLEWIYRCSISDHYNGGDYMAIIPLTYGGVYVAIITVWNGGVCIATIQMRYGGDYMAFIPVTNGGVWSILSLYPSGSEETIWPLY